jgi:hypothetical protein
LHSKDLKNARQEIGAEEADKVRRYIGTNAALSKAKGIHRFLNVNPETQFEIVRGLAGFERRHEIAIISSS